MTSHLLTSFVRLHDTQPLESGVSSDAVTKAESPDPETLLVHVRKHGRYPLSYSTLQPDLEYYPERIDVDGPGFIAYRTIREPFRTFRVVLGDPVCADADRASLLNGFLAASEPHFHCVFLQVHSPTATILSEHGYYVNEMGDETVLELSRLEEHKPRYLRNQLRLLRKHGLKVDIVHSDEADFEILRAVSDEWVRHSTIHGHELTFLARPFAGRPEPDVLIATLTDAGQIVGFAVLDPFFVDGKLAYLINIIRAIDDHASHRRPILLAAVAMRLQHEYGVSSLYLGFSPPYSHACPIAHASPFLGAILQALYRYGNWLYNFRGIYEHKRQYHGATVKVYVASRYRFPVSAVIASFHAMDIVLWRQLLRGASRVLYWLRK